MGFLSKSLLVSWEAKSFIVHTLELFLFIILYTMRKKLKSQKINYFFSKRYFQNLGFQWLYDSAEYWKAVNFSTWFKYYFLQSEVIHMKCDKSNIFYFLSVFFSFLVKISIVFAVFCLKENLSQNHLLWHHHSLKISFQLRNYTVILHYFILYTRAKTIQE